MTTSLFTRIDQRAKEVIIVKKSNPTVTVSMSLTQEDMSSFIRQKMNKVQQDVVDSQKRSEPPEQARQLARDLISKY